MTLDTRAAREALDDVRAYGSRDEIGLTIQADRCLYTYLPAALDALDAAESELTAWHAECGKVFVPYDPEGLVRHHRNNAEFAAAGYKQAAEDWQARAERAESELRETREALERVLAYTREHWQQGATPIDNGLLDGARRVLARLPTEEE